MEMGSLLLEKKQQQLAKKAVKIYKNSGFTEMISLLTYYCICY